jgi:hypothetical protein
VAGEDVVTLRVTREEEKCEPEGTAGRRPRGGGHARRGWVGYSQERYLRLEGHVQWISGQTMILATNTEGMDSYVPQALWSVRVDLREVPQDEYDTLTQGDFVIVTGVLVDDSWLAGISIERDLGS